MKIFRIIQKQYAIVGIGPYEQFTQKCPVNGREFLGFLLFGCLILTQLVYIYRVASSFMEYIVCICSVSGGIIVFVCFAAIVFGKISLFECIGWIENLIEISKMQSYRNYLYKWFILNTISFQTLKSFTSGCKYPISEAFFFKANQQIERLSEIVFMAMLKVLLQLLLLPKCIASFGIYFTTDSGSDSFQLPIPLW